MLHSMKKRVSKATSKVELQAEFEQYKGLLERVKKNMIESCKNTDESNKLWMSQMMQMNYVPRDDEDETAKVAEEFAEGSMERYDRFVRETSPELTTYHRMQTMVRKYIQEIGETESLYADLYAAKSEADRYQSKVDHLTKKSGSADEKKSRNLTKHEKNRDRYQAMSKHVVDSQKATYSKANTVSQMALVSYWEAQRHQLEIMQSSLSRTSAYSSTHVKDLGDVDVATLALPSAPTHVVGPSLAKTVSADVGNTA